MTFTDAHACHIVQQNENVIKGSAEEKCDKSIKVDNFFILIAS